MRRLPRRVAVIAVSACALTACAGSDEASDTMPTATAPPARVVTTTSSPRTATTTAPTTTLPTATTATAAMVDNRTAVLTAYAEYRGAIKRLFFQPDLASPAFGQLMTGRQRELIRAQVQLRFDENGRTEYPENSIARDAAIIESIAGATAIVNDCSVDDSFRRNLADGAISRTGVETSLMRATIVQEDGRWKVEHMSIERTWEGVAGCAASS